MLPEHVAAEKAREKPLGIELRHASCVSSGFSMHANGIAQHAHARTCCCAITPAHASARVLALALCAQRKDVNIHARRTGHLEWGTASSPGSKRVRPPQRRLDTTTHSFLLQHLGHPHTIVADQARDACADAVGQPCEGRLWQYACGGVRRLWHCRK